MVSFLSNAINVAMLNIKAKSDGKTIKTQILSLIIKEPKENTRIWLKTIVMGIKTSSNCWNVDKLSKTIKPQD